MGAGFKADTAELEQLAVELRAAGVKLADLEPVNTEAGRVVAAAARPPRRTGTLAAGSRSVASPGGVTFASTARYWTFVHYGAPRRNIKAHPWWPEAIAATRTEVLAVYTRHATDTLKTIG